MRDIDLRWIEPGTDCVGHLRGGYWRASTKDSRGACVMAVGTTKDEAMDAVIKKLGERNEYYGLAPMKRLDVILEKGRSGVLHTDLYDAVECIRDTLRELGCGR